jgi:deazaflavin-dependent oxidoreductase (nitroreductase family)
MNRLRLVFRSMNRGMVFMWRLGLGRWADAWPSVAGRVLVVEHRGRKTGTRYLTPLNFAPDGLRRYCLAAFGSKADWYRNVFATNHAVLWLPDGRWTALAVDVTDEEASRDRTRQVLIDSGFAARVFGLDPKGMTDAEIGAATSDYRLVRFDLIDRCDEAPADLSWVWAPMAVGATGIAAAAVVRRLRRRSLYGVRLSARFGTHPSVPSSATHQVQSPAAWNPVTTASTSTESSAVE